MATSIQLPSEERVIRENHRSPTRAVNRAHLKNLKKGVERKDRHSSSGINPSPKKAGRGGRFTWEGSDDYSPYDHNNALDNKDPNFVDDDAEEEQGREVPQEKEKNKEGDGIKEGPTATDIATSTKT